MKSSFLVLYRQLILIISCCLLFTALTGIVIGFDRHLIQLPDSIIQLLIDLHQGAFLGDKLVSAYVLLLGLGVFNLGLKIVTSKYDRLLSGSLAPVIADVYRIIALALVIPLAICVETGVAYRLGIDWWGKSEAEMAGYLSVHGGSFLDKPLNLIYLSLVGTTLVVLLVLSQNSRVSRKQTSNIAQQQFRSVFNQNITTKNSPLTNTKVKLAAIACVSIASIVLYHFGSASLMAIAIVAIATILLATVFRKNLIPSWQQPKQTSTILNEREAESVTMLRAIPDSMLRVSQNGTCLSYIPAQELSSFVLYGDIVNKHISEFLAPEIANQFAASIKSSLQNSSTNVCRFSISDDSGKQYFEARVNPIGEIEVLILVRKIDSSHLSSVGTQNFDSGNSSQAISILTELELSQMLEMKLVDIDQKNHVLLCLAIYTDKTTNVYATDSPDVARVDADLIFQIAIKIHSLLPSSTIARINDDDLIVLVSDRTMEKASIMVDELSREIDELLLSWHDDCHSIKFKIALLEINSDSLDASASIDAAKTACKMAKQKINLKTF